ncbi:MAG: Uma2 family endonuclease, partial [Deltaproteobacteria bacterium]|nr:Uma2 family endonuclease [Deltaproteobacteria bacterium]
MSTARRLHHSYEDYLRALEVSGVKLEYCEGEIYAMAGGTPAHADLAAAAMRLLG